MDSNPNDSGIDPQDEDDADDEPVSPQVADLELVKTVSNGTPNVGDVVTFSIKVDNKGPQAATNVKVEDVVPNGYDLTASTISDAGVNTTGTINWTVASIASGASKTLTFTAKVKAPVSGITYSNIAKIKSVDQYDPDSDPTNAPDKDGDGKIGSVDSNPNDSGIDPQDEDDADDEPVSPQVADLSLIKTVSDKYPKVGDNVIFTVKVSNAGPQAATNVKVEDVVPNGYSAISLISNSGTSIGNIVNWTIPSIASGSSVNLTFVVKVGQPASGVTFINLAQVKSVDQYDPDSNPGNGADTNGNGKVGSEDNDDSKDPADEDDGDDAYVIPTASLGDFVFEDKNGNGIQDPTEVGVSGVTVKLTGTDQDGNTVSLSTTTDTNGKYLFEDLVPGNYVVEFVKPAGYTGSDKDQGTDDTKDSDADKITGKTGTISLASGDNNLTVDAGIFKPAKLGDYVWEDTNYNGVQDATESPIQGVVVKLLDAAGNPAKDADGNNVASTTTDAVGKYEFTNLKPGVQYVVEFTKPAGYEPTSKDKGTDDTKDSDADTTTGKAPAVVLASGENNPTIDAGFYKPATIGDFVFEDKNGNGIQDATEPGIPGVTVTLNGTDGSGNPVTATTTTGPNGEYTFTGLKPGDYTVTFTKPGGYTTTDPNQGTDDTKDSDASKTTGTTQSVTVKSGETNNTLDAGYFKPAKLGDYVWEDTNYNGVQDPTESPIQGVVVKLLDAAGNPAKDADGNNVASTTTDAAGKYEFTNLKPGVQYVVEFTKPAGYEPTSKDKGTDDTKDSDADTTTGKAPAVVLASGENNPTIDAGFYKPATIGDFVFEDKNGNGIQDATEPGIPGVTVTLNGTDGSGNPVTATTTTGPNGEYTFTGLKPGDYTVTFTKPGGYTTTDPNQGTDDTKDSDASKTTGTTQSVTVKSGETNNTLDAGYFKPAKLGDYVWEDTNYNGVQDATESPIQGVVVKLLDAAGNPAKDADGNNVASTTTDAVGKYEFTNLKPGVQYVVEFTKPAGYEPTSKDKGTDDTKDSDADTTTGKAPAVVLASGENNPTIDAGFYKPATIGDFVFEDKNGNGIQDATEPGIPGVTVTLNGTDGSGNPVTATTTTGPNGEYTFTGLKPGDYTVTFTKPGGYTTTDPNQGTDDTKDSDASKTTGTTQSVTVKSGETNNTLDAGYFKPAKLGDYVWEDTNYNGVQDPTESPIQGVVVKLLDAAGNPAKDADGNPVASTTTDAAGKYEFTNLKPGVQYVVEFTKPAGYEPTSKDKGTDDTKDSDADTTTGKAPAVVLASGENNPTIDAGFYKPATIGDFVFEDKNGNGIQDATEPGIPGVTVTLNGTDGSGNPVTATTTTGPNGEYTFTGLKPGDYTVTFTKPGGYTTTDPNQGTDDTKDSDASKTTGTTQSVTVKSGETNNTLDAGYFKPAKLGDYVWEDTNYNGVQDPTESPIQGVVVKLLDAAGNPAKDADGNPVASTTTDAAGKYEFTNLKPGVQYVVEFTKPAGYEPTSKDKGTDDTKDSDADTTTGKAPAVVLTSGENNPTIDAGFYKPATIGDFVFEDKNGNGIQDATEPGIPGVTVTLNGTDGSGNPVTATTTTGPNGEYTFTGLKPGDYTVTFTKPGGYTTTDPNQGTDDTKDSDASKTTGTTQSVTVKSGETNNTLDAGYFKPAKLGDYVWEDTNYNGVQDPTESPIQGVVVKLLDAAGNPAKDADGNPVASTTTDAAGKYEFTNLKPGVQYVVEFTKPAGYEPTSKDKGTDDTKDSDADTTTGKAPAVVLASGENNPTIDAGFYKPATIGDFVFEDKNGNGIQDATEPGIPGVTVTLNGTDGSGNPVTATTTTGPNGEYTFTGLKPGDYTVTFTKPGGYTTTDPNQGTDDTKDSDASKTTGTTQSVTVKSGETNNTLDAGYFKPAKLGDYVWEDTNYNGVQDATESPIQGVVVKLLDAAGNPAKDADGNNVASTTTDAAGKYEFTNLKPGVQYVVEFTKPAGYEPTSKDKGTDDTKDSDADTTTGKAPAVVLASGENNPTIDAGFYKPATIGDFVFEDKNGNGIQDATEPGIPGVTVTLNGTDGSGNPVTATTTTGPNGEYTFTGLKPGDYTVTFTKPGGYTTTDPNQGTDDTKDSDASKTTGTTQSVTVKSGETNNTLDAGYFKPAKLGDYVWEDTNYNGVQDPTESPIQGVVVKLLDAAGNPAKDADGNNVASTTTDAAGKYEFTNLKPGVQYVVEFTKPAGYEPTSKDKGTDDTKDSDADTTTGKAPAVVLASGENNPTIDAGFYKPATIGDFVFEDKNGNGIQDATEPGIPGVTVTLNGTDGSGNPVTATTTTGPNGEYTFTGLKPGDYTVTFTKPGGYTTTDPNQGTDDTKDSDASKTTGTTQSVTVKSGETNNTLDAGYFKPAKLGDYVWEDTNYNGVQDATESPIQGVVVKLLDAAGNPAKDADGNNVASTTTDAAGKYEFTNLKPGVQYVVEFTKPAGYEPTSKDKGTDDTKDSDADTTTGKAPAVVLASGENNPTIDAGFYKPATIGDFVFEDKNGNGIQDATEPGIPGVTVTLNGTDGSGNPVTATTTTGPNGEYTFTGLKPGDYTVTFTKPGGYTTTDPNQGTDDTKDSDASKTTGTTQSVTVKSGETNNTLDAGYFKPAKLGDYVWEDTNYNGVQDPTESPIQGVVVKLLDAAGNPAKDADGNNVASTTTDAAGKYEFTNLKPGVQYVVEFTKPAGYEPTSKDKGTDDTKDSDADTTTGKAPAVVLASGENNPTIDAGFYKPATIGDFVFEDKNGNGIQDATEPGIPGVTVTLNGTDGSGNPVTATTTTGPNGEYTFTGLKPGDYTVTFTKPGGYTTTDPNQGTDDTKDSDASKTTGTTQSVTVKSGETNNTLDAGYFKPAKLGDYVWEDTNYNGVQDPTESPIQGVVVKLLDAAGNPAKDADGNNVASTTTDAAGKYEFTNLKPGVQYVVEFTKPAGYEPTSKDKGTDDTKDSDADTTTGKAPAVVLTSGENNPTIDAGFYKPATIGDFVFEDKNGNGIQDATEPGIPGVTVTLNGTDGSGNPVTATTTTRPNGEYTFTGLKPGDYTVTFTKPGGYTTTDPNQGTDDTKDSDASKTTGTTQSVTVKSGETNNTLDAGYFKPAKLGDYVWEDTNYNGVQDPTESPIQGVVVKLLDAAGNPAKDADGNPVASTTTDAAGKYEFTNLKPGVQYVVEFTKPAGYEPTSKDKGTDDTKDSDADTTTGKAPAVVLASGENNPTIDAGFYKPATIGDFVFEDKNGNGIQDATEPGIPGVTVTLNGTDGSGNPVTATTTTGPNGEYTFTGLKPGDYTVTFTKPGGYTTTDPNQGTDDTKDSDASKTTGTTQSVTVKSGETNNTLDAGYFKPAKLGDYVWEDTNYNGVQDPTESPIQGVVVKLLDAAGNPAKDADGNPVASTTTDAAGKYEFTNLKPGVQYVVEFTKPAGYEPTSKDKGTDDTKDSDADTTTGKAPAVVLTSGENNPTIDAGFYKPATIGDFVFEDKNGNGIQDATEPGIPGVTVTLNGTDGSGNPVTATTTTGPNGEYTFTGLKPGDYTVTFTKPGGYTTTDPNQGTDDTKDSDASKTTGTTQSVTVKSGETNNTLDAGYFKPAKLGDYVWEDTNYNGVQDPTESPIQGVVVKLLDAAGNPAKDADGNPVASTTTDAAGKYEFTNLKPGVQYVVEFTKPAGYEPTSKDKGTDDTKDSDADTTTGKAPAVVLASGENNPTIDAGFYKPATIGDFVFEDKNGNGIQDATEPGIPGVTVTLNGTDGSGNPVTATTTTGPNGEYTFTGLKPGDYTVTFTKPGGYTTTDPNQGTDDTKDSDASKTTGTTQSVTVKSGETNNTLDAGYFKPAKLGDYVWEDVNKNGIQEFGEKGIQGVTVKLIGTTGTGAGVNLTATTDANGFYQFTNLTPGTYIVEFVTPGAAGDYTNSPKDQGTNDGIDSDADQITGKTSTIIISSGDDNQTVDAGFYRCIKTAEFNYPITKFCYKDNTILIPTFANGAVAGAFTASPSLGTALNGTSGNITVSLANSGLYTITNTIVADGKCPLVSATTTVKIPEPLEINGNIITKNVSCFGGNDGSATVTALGGTPSYSYNWLPSGGTSATATGLTAGTYTVTVTDANNCKATATVVITQPTLLTASTQGVNVKCFGGNDGSATVTALGGTPSYTYNWLPSGGTSATATGLTAGTYTVTVTDANNCKATATVVITQPTLLTASTQGVNVKCFGGNDGSATVTALGGTPSYTYNWLPSGGTSATATGLTAGTYTVTVTDANNCKATATVVITQPTLLTASTQGVNVKCFGGNDGSATVTALGGTPSYTYNWLPSGGTSATATGLTAGTYTVTVTDANNCKATATVVITQPTLLTASTQGVNVKCFGGNDGSATVTALGGTPSYTYNWLPSGGTSATATGLTAGTYTVTVTDANNCKATATVVITQPTLLTASTQGVNVKCFGGNDGSATVTALGGTPSYTYNWLPSGGTSATATGLTAGTYTVTVTDANNCKATATVVITQPTLLTASTQGVNVKCFGGNDGSATVTALGGTPSYTYNWLPSGGTSATATGLTAGTYTVTVTDANNCKATATVVITQPNVLEANTSTVDVTCNGGKDGSISVLPSGGTIPYTYKWNTGATTQVITALPAGTYSVIVTDANGCTKNITNIAVGEPVKLTPSASSNSPVCFGDPINLSTSGGSTYAWTGPNGFNSTSQNPIINNADLVNSGVYSVTVTNIKGCTGTATVSVEVRKLDAINLTNISLCQNENLTLTVPDYGVGATYLWTGPNSFTSSLRTASISNVSATNGGTYTIKVTTNGCSVTGTVSVTIKSRPSAPTIQIDGPTTICETGSVKLTSTACVGTVKWSNLSTGTSITVNSAGTYTATCTSSESCESVISNSITIQQGNVPSAPVITASKTICCDGEKATLTATGCTGTLKWSTGETTPTIQVGVAADYTATCSNSCGSSVASNKITIQTGVAPTVPVLTALDIEVCGTETVTITASNCNGTIKWSHNAALTATSVTVGEGTYTAKCITICGESAASLPVVITKGNTPSAPSITSNKTAVCPTETATLTATGCDGGTITWSGGGVGTTKSVGAGTYTATCTTSCGTSGTSNTIVIGTNPSPVAPSIAANKTTICGTEKATLTASGCTDGTINWSVGGTGLTKEVGAGTYTATCTNVCGTSVASASVTIVTGAAPNAPTVTTDKTVCCDGEKATLTATGCTGTVTWSNLATGTTTQVSESGTYTATCTTSCGTSVSSQVITIQKVPTPVAPTITAGATTVCGTEKVTLTASACAIGTLKWSTGETTLTISVGAGTYTAYCENVCGKSPNSNPLTITTRPAPTAPSIVANKTTICGTEKAILTASGCTDGTINWSVGGTGLTKEVGAGTYTATCTNSCGTSAASASVTITTGALPSAPSITSNKTAVCPTETATLTATGCDGGTITWSGGGVGTTKSVGAGTYTATCTTSCGTSGTSNTIVIGTNPSPVAPSIAANKTTICGTEKATLTASGCTDGTINWSVGGTGLTKEVGAGTYTATCTNVCGTSVASASVTIVTGAAPNAPTVTTDKTVCCDGEKATLTATGCTGTVTWSNLATGTTTQVSESGTYTATCTTSCGTSVSSQVITIQKVPTPVAPTITAGATTVCGTEKVTLTASACAIGTLKWSTGETTLTISVGAGTYTAYCENVCGKSPNSNPLTITTRPAPTAPSIVANKTTICGTEKAILTASGCTDGTINWSVGGTGLTKEVGAGTYTATCTNSCGTSAASASVTITTGALPSAPSITSNKTAVCPTETATLTATGCDGGTITWSGGGVGTTKSVGAGTYTATCTTSCGTSGTSNTIVIGTNPSPVAPSIAANKTTICGTEKATLTASGCTDGTINWSVGGTGLTKEVGAGTYTATCTNVCGTSVASASVTIVTGAAPNAPTVTTDKTVCCDGEKATLTATGCTGTVTWSNLATGTTTQVSESGTYTATCTTSCGTSVSSQVITIQKVPTPVAPTITAGATTVCGTEKVTLTASACAIGTLKWSTGETTLTISVGAGTYTAYCENVCGKSPNSNPLTITTRPAPTAPSIVANKTTICGTEKAILTASGCTDGTINWSVGGTGLTKEVGAGTYTATCTNSCGTSAASASVTITTGALPSAPSITSNKTAVCPTETATLTATGCDGGTITWSGGGVGTTKSVGAGTYTATCTTSCGTSGTSNTIVIGTNPSPVAPSIAANKTTICGTEKATLTASGCTDGTINWSVGGTGLTKEVGAGTYTATCTNVCGTSVASASVTIVTGAAPNAPTVTTDKTVCCDGEKATLTATGCTGTVTWSNLATGTTTQVSESGTYTATCTTSCGTSVSSQVITIQKVPTPVAPTITAGATTVCGTEKVTLTASACAIGTLKWSTGETTLTISVGAGTYTAYCENVCGKSPNSNPLTITTRPAPTAPSIVANKTTICGTEKAILTASGCTDGTINWSVGGTGLTKEVGAGTYTATCTNSCGTSAASASVTITTGALPSAPSITSNKTAVCPTETATLTATGCDGGTITWSGGGVGTTKSVGAGTYTATCTTSCGTSGTSNTIVIGTNPSPVAPSIAANKTTICGTEKATLTASGCTDGTINWSVGGTGLTKEVGAGTYTATCTNVCGTSVASASVTIVTGAAPNAPTVTTDKTVCCDGEKATLTATGCTGTVTWSNLATGTTTQVSESGTYTATCTTSCGTSVSSQVITIQKVPTPVAPTITAGATTVCGTEKVTLTASACAIGTLKWSTGETTLTISVGAGTYTAYCENVCGKSPNSNPLTITTRPAPTAPSIVANKTTICGTEKAILTASGCTDGTINWSVGGTGLTKEVGAGTYTATCTNSCGTSAASASVTITTGALPSAPSITSNKTAVCPTETATLTATGCDGGTITWSGGGVGTTKSVGAGTYTATCTTSCGTSGTSNTIVIGTNPSPVAPSIAANKTTICGTEKATLTASGCTDGTINWSVGGTGLTKEVGAGTYTATCTNVCGTSVASASVTIVTGAAPNAPTVTTDKTVCCDGEKATLTATGCTGTVTWSNLATGTTTQVSESGTYTATCTTSCGTSVSSQVITIQKVPTPVAPTITAGATTVCGTEKVTLTASACAIGTLKWSTGETTLTISVGAGTYTAYCENVCGKSPNSNPLTITTRPAPTAPSIVANKTTICGTEKAILTASGCTDGTINWSVGGTGLTKEVGAGTYTATCTNSCGTSAASASVTITTGALPSAPSITSNKTAVCPTETATLTATGCDGGTITWSGGGVGTTKSVGAGTYTATCTTSCGTSGTSNTIVIGTNPSPVAPSIAANKTTICGTEKATLTASGCTDGTINWSVGGTGLTKEVGTGTYTATCTNSCGTSGNSNSVTISNGAAPSCTKHNKQ